MAINSPEGTRDLLPDEVVHECGFSYVWSAYNSYYWFTHSVSIQGLHSANPARLILQYLPVLVKFFSAPSM